MTKKLRIIESHDYNQWGILECLRKQKKKKGCKWLSKQEIMYLLRLDYTNTTEKNKMQKKLKALFKFGFLNRKRNAETVWGNEYVYKAKKR